MAWAYLIVFDDDLGSRNDVQKLLDNIPEVTYWYSCMPNVIFLTSTVNAQTLADKVHERFGRGRGKRFLVTEVHQDRQGWLPKKVWHMFKHPDNPRSKES